MGAEAVEAQMAAPETFTGDLNTTIGYLLYPSPGFVEASIQVDFANGSAGVTGPNSAADVLNLRFSDETFPYSSTLSSGCGLGCQALAGSGTFSVTNYLNNQ